MSDSTSPSKRSWQQYSMTVIVSCGPDPFINITWSRPLKFRSFINIVWSQSISGPCNNRMWFRPLYHKHYMVLPLFMSIMWSQILVMNITWFRPFIINIMWSRPSDINIQCGLVPVTLI